VPASPASHAGAHGRKANLEGLYKGLVDAWVLYDKSETVPLLLDWGEKR
jgi:hypothetical protein